MDRKTQAIVHIMIGFISIALAELTVQSQSENITLALPSSVKIFGADKGLNSLEMNRHLDHKVRENHDPRDDGFWPCPDPADISPCVCCALEENTIRDMDCSSVTSDQEIVTAFSADMPFYTYRTLTILNVQSESFTTLNEFSFGLASFSKVIITNTSLQFIGDGTFATSEEHLTSMVLSNNMISIFPFETLNTMRLLTELYLDGNKITSVTGLESQSLGKITLSNNIGLQIDTDLISNMPNLTSLYMEKCDLTNFVPGILQDLSKIEVFSIAHNKLTALAKESIYTLTSLWSLVLLSGNPISIVQEDFLSEFQASGRIEMANANIIEIDETVWRPYFSSLKEQSINLEGNPLRCGCDIAWLFNEATNFYMKLTSGVTCSDGTLVYDLPPDAFMFHCT